MAKKRQAQPSLRAVQNDNPNIIAIMTALVILIAPFNRGLFFDNEFFYATISLTVIFGGFLLARKVTNNQPPLAVDPIGVSAWALVLVYVLTMPAAINIRGSIGEIIRWGTYLLLYYLVAYASITRKDLDFYLKVIYTTGVLVALAGLGTAFGSFNFVGAFEKDTGRILSTLQYANSLAIYLNAIFIIGLYLITRTNARVWIVLYGIGNFLLFITFIGTQSRGGWLVFPLVTLLLLLGQPAKLRMKFLANVTVVMLVSFSLSGKVLNFVQGAAASAGSYWLWLSIGILLAGVLHYALVLIFEKVQIPELSGSSKRSIFLVLGVVLVVLLAGAGIIAVKPDVLPEQLVERIKNINFEQHSVQERLYFYQDAFKVIKDYPLFGTGGKGWEAVYQKYQSYLYLSNQVHSHFLQVWVEAGVFGFIAFLAVWAAFFVTTFRAYRTAKRSENAEDTSRVSAIAVGALTLGLHSLIDFNLSLGAISLVLWCLFGLVTANQRVQQSEVRSISKYHMNRAQAVVYLGTIALAGILFFASFSLETALSYAASAAGAIQNQDFTKAQQDLESAMAYDPFQASYPSDLGQIISVMGSQQKDKKLLQQGLDYQNKALELNSTNAKVFMMRSRVYLAMGEIDRGVQDLEQTLVLGPWNQSTYDAMADLYFQVGRYCFNKGEKDKAKLYFEKSVKVSERLNQQVGKLTSGTKKLWIRAPMLTVSPAMQEAAKKSQDFLSQM